MGEVYAAEDERLRREVAIKFISRENATDRRAQRRFELEARAASALNHPNICTIFEVDDYQNTPFIVMELLEGSNLSLICSPKLKFPSGLQYELIRDCVPDAATTKCAATVRESEASFRTIPFTDAWYFGAALLSFVGKKDAAIRLLRSATEHSFCVYPSVDYDPLFDSIRQSEEFKAVRQAGVECQRKFAPYTRIQIQ